MFLIKKTLAERKGVLLEITESVRTVVEESGIDQGVVVVSTPYVDAGILCTSFFDPKGHEDIMDDFGRIWPARDNFYYDGSVVKGAAHGKSAVAGTAMDFIVDGGELMLGDSQGIFLAEYCEPEPREYQVKVFGCKKNAKKAGLI